MKKNITILILSILLVSFFNFFENFYLLLKRDYNTRLNKIYSFCEKESVGFADEESMKIIGEGKSNGTVRLIACPTTNSTDSYVQSTGLSDKEVKSLEIKYGKNILAVEVRTFF